MAADTHTLATCHHMQAQLLPTTPTTAAAAADHSVASKTSLTPAQMPPTTPRAHACCVRTVCADVAALDAEHSQACAPAARL